MSLPSSRDEMAVAERAAVYGDVSRAAGWGIGANIALALLKFAGGIFTGSTALVADGVNSVGDIAGSLAVRGSLWVAQRDEDADHPYGHTKAEAIAGLSVSLLVAFSAIALAIETLRRLAMPLVPPPLAAAAIAAAAGIAKEVLFRYTRRVAIRQQSAALRAAAWDHRGDALCSGGIAVALAASQWLGPAGAYVDPLAGLAVCLLLLVVGTRIFFRTARELMDQQADEAVVEGVRNLASEVAHVHDVEKLRIRKSGLEYFVEIHIHVDGQISVDEGHRIGHDVKDRLLAHYPRIRDVLVHIEPAE